MIFLGGRESSTIKEISENWLGKATISMQTEGRSRGQSESYNQNTQRLGRELMTPSELATMPGDKCILQLRGLPPFFSSKYDLKQHPNYKYTAEADKKKNAFDLDKLINRRRRPGLNEACEVYEEMCIRDSIITILTRYYLSQGKTAPVYHYYARPPIAEEEATGRAIALAKAADCPLFVVHVSIREAMEAIRNAHNDGWPIFGETCTHYLTLTTDCLDKPGFEGAKYICSPPLRPQEHVDALWQAVRAVSYTHLPEQQVHQEAVLMPETNDNAPVRHIFGPYIGHLHFQPHRLLKQP